MWAIQRLAKIEDMEQEDAFLLTDSLTPQLRTFGALNVRGLWTLVVKEVRRFMKIPGQTILSPMVMTLLFYAVFAVSMGKGQRVGDVSFLRFLVPGLILMPVMQAAFMNNAASLVLSKIQGNIVDVLMTPLSPLELTVGYAFAGLARGLVVGAATLGVLLPFAPVTFAQPLFIAYHAAMASLMLSLIGLITGLWGRDFDQMASVQNFVIMPATFLSGTFFAASSLPGMWRWTCSANPFFYLIDGFRYGFIGISEGSVWGGAAIVLFINLALCHVAYWMFAHGTGLKS